MWLTPPNGLLAHRPAARCSRNRDASYTRILPLAEMPGAAGVSSRGRGSEPVGSNASIPGGVSAHAHQLRPYPLQFGKEGHPVGVFAVGGD